MAPRGAALAAAACLLLAAAGPASAGTSPNYIKMRTGLNGSAVINMTDYSDMVYGTIQWSGKDRMRITDDVTIHGSVTAAEIDSAGLRTSMDVVKKVLACAQESEFYDSETKECAVVASRRTNDQVRHVISGHGYHLCIVMWDYSVRCWGYFGEYSMGGFGDGTDRYLPTESPAAYSQQIREARVPMMPTMQAVAYNYYNVGMIMADGTIWMVGYGSRGTIGNGQTSHKHYFVQAQYLDNVTSIAAGGQNSEPTYCAINGDGLLYCWGWNNAGQCGVGHKSNVNVPTRVLSINKVKMVDITLASTASTCAVTWGGEVFCWGYNGYGQLGNGGTGNYDSPSQVGSEEALRLEGIDYIKWHGSSQGTVMALRKSDGSVWCWGYGSHGQNGAGDTNHRKKAAHVKTTTGQDLTDVKSLHPANGDRYGSLCVLKNDATVWCWGYNNHGQVGTGNTQQRNAAQQVVGITDIAGVENPYMIDHSYAYHTVCAHNTLAAGGYVWCWGYNNYGQLGVGDTSQRYSPIKVHQLSNIRALGSRAYHASSGDTTFYAVSEDSYTMWAWGYGGHGQPGSHTTPIGANRIPQKVRLT